MSWKSSVMSVRRPLDCVCWQDLNNMAEYRPTLDELMLGKVEARDKVEEEVDTRGGKVIKFGWIEGVLMRCLLNIWGTN